LKDSTKTISFSVPELEASDFQKKIPILTFIGGSQVGRRVLLADDAITLGRSHGSTIMINDPAVSRLHVKIEYDPQSSVYAVNDLGSSNGTLVNGKTIKTSALSEGDKIIIGQTVLRFSWIDAVDMVFHGEVDRLINIDGLTGLVVKRRFDEDFSRHVAVALRNESPLSMLMIDMDGLKRINDTYGHPFGAYSISETAKIIKNVISSKGLASRFGGDEFMAFLPNTPVDKAREIAEEIRRNVEQHNYEKDNTRFSLTISIGLAMLKENDTPETFFKRADDALYISKKSGRNRVSVIEK
jgi:two-component system cell cycle response regulator